MRNDKPGGTRLFVSERCLGTMTFGGGGMRKQIGGLDPVIGAMRADQLDHTIAATEIELTGAGLDTLDQVGALPEAYSDWMSERQLARAAQLAQAGRKTAR